MARIPERNTSRAESKTGLIITLVFFVLSTIGLGVATFYGFAEQEGLAKKADEAEGKQKNEAKMIEFYKYQAMLYWNNISQVNGYAAADLEEFAVLREKFQDGKILPSGEGVKGLEEIVKEREKHLTAMGQRVGFKDASGKLLDLKFDSALKRPSSTMEEILLAQSKRYSALETRFNRTEEELKEGQVKEKQLADDLAAYKKKTGELVKSSQMAHVKEFKDFKDELEKTRVEKDGLRKALELEKTERAKAADDAKDDLDKIAKKLRDRDLLVGNLQSQLILERTKENEVASNIRPEFKIVNIDRTGTTLYINLGFGDRIKPQDTFSIHGISADGRPNPNVKGSLEIVNIVGEHLAQCRIITVKNSNKDPILKGDVVFNPIWSSGATKRVAIMGIIDLQGTGKDNIFEFIKQLENKGVLVDSYLDPTTFEIKNQPGITPKTDYLIEGDNLDFIKELRGRTQEDMARLTIGIQTLRNSAKENGVIRMDIRKYLEMAGYRVPRNFFEQGPNPNAQFARPGQGKAAEPMKEVEKKEPEKKEVEKKEPEKKDAEKKEAEKKDADK